MSYTRSYRTLDGSLGEGRREEREGREEVEGREYCGHYRVGSRRGSERQPVFAPCVDQQCPASGCPSHLPAGPAPLLQGGRDCPSLLQGGKEHSLKTGHTRHTASKGHSGHSGHTGQRPRHRRRRSGGREIDEEAREERQRLLQQEREWTAGLERLALEGAGVHCLEGVEAPTCSRAVARRRRSAAQPRPQPPLIQSEPPSPEHSYYSSPRVHLLTNPGVHLLTNPGVHLLENHGVHLLDESGVHFLEGPEGHLLEAPRVHLLPPSPRHCSGSREEEQEGEGEGATPGCCSAGSGEPHYSTLSQEAGHGQGKDPPLSTCVR